MANVTDDDGKVKELNISVANHNAVRSKDGAADTLVGEELELDSDFLCVAVETTKQKDLNSSLRSQLRSEAKKRG